MKIVALEEHFITEEVRLAWTRCTGSSRDESFDRFNTPVLENRLKDLGEARLRQMDESGVDVQVLSLNTPGVQNLDAVEAVAIARQANDLMARTIERRPDRFEGFATLPTPDPIAAALELERAVSVLGLRGAMLMGRTGERHLDDPSMLPIFETAARLRVPLYLHPQIPVAAVRQSYYSGFGDTTDVAFATLGWGWHYETGVEAVRLILSGLFDRFPDLQIILGHWGETMLFYLERIDVMSKFAPNLKRSVSEYVRQNFYVTPSGMLSPTYLRWSIETIGVERIMFSTDYPYQIAPGRGARDFVESAALSDAEKVMIAHANWDDLKARARSSSAGA
ncbi:putative TIM-barrel fold metal-dependent hydrolase [Sphingomonas kyeonggiensis]|uniref:Putative TIM-barrel fold metal-dependent hydrolase n=1 Tax=Sphingomonas kyeonggiensis TaxID=1268553 RepID=A0A7W7K581_9SPHN|nr:amidohydrolase family protein [Sphingomonas kyeonggiensis]MBB4840942.1 putative TIM-barrel fold metal-dependent hydrolase [Sphingomonas kyeonggiensis]